MTFICRVCDYIKYSWDVLLIDPDGGANVQNKLQAAHLNRRPEDIVLLQKNSTYRGYSLDQRNLQSPQGYF